MAVPVLESTADAVQKLAWVHDVLGPISTGDYASLAPGEQREAASSLARMKARVTAHELAAVAAVEKSGAARRQGATSTGSLLASDFGGDRREADARVRQARRIESTPASHRAMADGSITQKQARVIGDALDLLPAAVERELRDACESQLVDHAQRLDLPTFKRRADRVVGSFLVEPDDTSGLDAAENQIVADRERRAWGKAEFWMTAADRDGAVKGGFTLPEAQAAMLKTAAVRPAGSPATTVCSPQYWAVTPCRSTSAAPSVCSPPTREQPSPCATKGASSPDVIGHPAWSRHNRRVAVAECRAHHANDRWADGGSTNLSDRVLLCPHHHRVVHNDGWQVRFTDGIEHLVPPASIDPRRRPRRHDRFARTTT